MLLLGTSPINWKSKKQSTMSKSSTEAECRAMSQAVAEVTWLIRLLSELGVPQTQPITLHSDSRSALQLAKNPVFHDAPSTSKLIIISLELKFLKGYYT